MGEIERFFAEVDQSVAELSKADDLRDLSYEWMQATEPYKYSYNFTWLGRPIIQMPADIIAMQELIWSVKPELIVETGIAHGGSLIFYASMLHLLGCDGFVIGIDVDIRAHNRAAIEKHPMAARIKMIEGSSTDEGVFRRVEAAAVGRKRTMVVLDSNHTHEHVLGELRRYSKLVPKGSYLVVFDTVLEYVRDKNAAERPWGVGNNPLTAVNQFLSETDRFVADKSVDGKLLLTVAPGGYLKCVKD